MFVRNGDRSCVLGKFVDIFSVACSLDYLGVQINYHLLGLGFSILRFRPSSYYGSVPLAFLHQPKVHNVAMFQPSIIAICELFFIYDGVGIVA